MLSAFEILELFLELLAVRAQLIAKTKEIPRDMIEAISSIIYSANRVPDSPELVTLKKMLEQKYGGEYVKEASSDLGAPKWQVNANLLRCLLIEAPSGESKLACLSEIAQDHGVEWDASVAAKDLLPPPPPPQPPPRSSQTLVANDTPSFPSPINYPGNPATATAIKLPPPMVSLPPPPPQTQAQPYPTIQTQQMVMPPPPPPGLVQYIDATTAAAAAQHAASQARAAADFAAQFAMQSAGLAPPPQPQPTQRLPTFSHTPPAPPPPPPSTNEVQRAYDEALGPPTKEEKEKDDLPSAPPTPQSPRTEDDSDALPPSVPLTLVPPPASSQDEGGAFSFLPSPPRATVAPPQPEEEPDEYAVLAKRLEMLKKS